MTSKATDLAAQMVTGCAILSEQGLVEGFGHLSARLPDGAILMTPRKTLALVQEEELLTLDLDGNVLAGEGRPAVESAMHLAIYRHRPDVGAIARTHSRACAVFGVAGRPVRAVHRFGSHLGAEVPVHPDFTLVGARELGDAVASFLGDRQAVLLRGNGTLITAPTLVEAVTRAIWLEESASIQLAALSAGLEPHYLSADEAQRAAAMDMPHEPIRAWEFYAALAAGDVI
ncbi:MAG TPA: class II aldolase/adducin family protein [Chloroflexota bacterium]|jgi:ribulose-5-phosphate 4-epimerase/fuculose-1-phosphate aldolase